MPARTTRFVLTAVALTAFPAVLFVTAQQPHPTPDPSSLRLYVLDCGKITGVSPALFGFKEGELATTEMMTPCYLIVHSKGTLLWDTGEIPDSAVKTDGTPTTQGNYTVIKPLLPQLAALGYKPADITYLAFSHYHTDHVANANAFAGSTWIVQKVERDAMFAPPDPKASALTAPNPALFGALEKSKTVLLNSEDHDVFGDGSVVIKFSPGHTPGHQSLFVKLAKTGPVLLSGDLYHYPEELTMKRLPTIEFDQAQTAKSRAAIEDFARKNNASIWIQHSALAGVNRKKAPEFYD